MIYAPAISDLLRHVDVHAIAHITGGGIRGNLARVLGGHTDAVVHRRKWEVPRIFSEIQNIGSVSDEEMERVFNLGIGMVLAVPAMDAYKALDRLRASGHLAVEIGQVTDGDGTVNVVS